MAGFCLSKPHISKRPISLKDNVKDELIRLGIIINTLNKLIKEAININDKLFKRTIEKRYNRGVSRIGRSSFFAKLKSYRLGYKERDPYGLILIELDYIEKKGKDAFRGLGRGKK